MRIKSMQCSGFCDLCLCPKSKCTSWTRFSGNCSFQHTLEEALCKLHLVLHVVKLACHVQQMSTMLCCA